jgi:hypothetical protein
MPIFSQIDTFSPQSPLDELDNSFLFDCVPPGDAVASASVSVMPADDTMTFTDQTIAGNLVTVWVTGGIAGTVYTLTVTANTTQGRIYARSGNLPPIPSNVWIQPLPVPDSHSNMI